MILQHQLAWKPEALREHAREYRRLAKQATNPKISSKLEKEGRRLDALAQHIEQLDPDGKAGKA